ncbi:hypothetical protein JK358_26210 [Nocardia sp. 2]|uniref:Ig-like domain-containing protein n=1 Tax=Nocardia acididurans TaxID=2802282 RepID=A0ABS1MDV3_9NOCA|nr:hypothetical protein [Nocardia acididurans]MBL1077904.1 hypothetical protein [Nocardia acididurans]
MIRTILITTSAALLTLAVGACTGEQGPIVVAPVTASAVAGATAQATATATATDQPPPTAAASECAYDDPAAIDEPLPGGYEIADLTAGDATAQIWTAEANGTQYWWARGVSGSGYLTATWGPGSEIAYTCVRGPGAVRTPAIPWKLPGATQGSLPNSLQFCLSAWSAAEPACWSYS